MSTELWTDGLRQEPQVVPVFPGRRRQYVSELRASRQPGAYFRRGSAEQRHWHNGTIDRPNSLRGRGRLLRIQRTSAVDDDQSCDFAESSGAADYSPRGLRPEPNNLAQR